MRFDYIAYCKQYFKDFQNNIHLIEDSFENKNFTIKIKEAQLVNRNVYFIDYNSNYLEELQVFIGYYLFFYLKQVKKIKFINDKSVYIFYTNNEKKLPFFDVTSKALPFDIQDWNQLSSSTKFKFYITYPISLDNMTDLEEIKHYMDTYL
jgi:hypothetical protein